MKIRSIQRLDKRINFKIEDIQRNSKRALLKIIDSIKTNTTSPIEATKK